jgi:hypothetical protein
MTQHFRPDHKTALDAMLLGVPGVTPGHLFGHPSYKIVGKIFLSILEDGIILKLPPEALKAVLAGDHAEPFAPMGNVMKAWAYVHVKTPADYGPLQDIIQQALEFVLALETGRED